MRHLIINRKKYPHKPPRHQKGERIIKVLVIALSFAISTHALADDPLSYRKASECISASKLDSLGSQQSAAAIQIHSAISSGAIIRSDLCDSLKNVIAIIAQTGSSSGRQLEKDRKVSPALALHEYQLSIAQPDISRDIATATRNNSNQNFKTLMEAVALHDNGKYEARDHILAQLEKR